MLFPLVGFDNKTQNRQYETSNITFSAQDFSGYWSHFVLP